MFLAEFEKWTEIKHYLNILPKTGLSILKFCELTPEKKVRSAQLSAVCDKLEVNWI